MAKSRCWDWGLSYKIPAENYVGGPVPFLRNPAKSRFTCLLWLNLIFLLLCSVTFSIQMVQINRDRNDRDEKLEKMDADEATDKTSAEYLDLLDDSSLDNCD